MAKTKRNIYDGGRDIVLGVLLLVGVFSTNNTLASVEVGGADVVISPECDQDFLYVNSTTIDQVSPDRYAQARLAATVTQSILKAGFAIAGKKVVGPVAPLLSNIFFGIIKGKLSPDTNAIYKEIILIALENTEREIANLELNTLNANLQRICTTTLDFDAISGTSATDKAARWEKSKELVGDLNTAWETASIALKGDFGDASASQYDALVSSIAILALHRQIAISMQYQGGKDMFGAEWDEAAIIENSKRAYAQVQKLFYDTNGGLFKVWENNYRSFISKSYRSFSSTKAVTLVNNTTQKKSTEISKHTSRQSDLDASIDAVKEAWVAQAKLGKSIIFSPLFILERMVPGKGKTPPQIPSGWSKIESGIVAPCTVAGFGEGYLSGLECAVVGSSLSLELSAPASSYYSQFKGSDEGIEGISIGGRSIGITGSHPTTSDQDVTGFNGAEFYWVDRAPFNLVSPFARIRLLKYEAQTIEGYIKGDDVPTSKSGIGKNEGGMKDGILSLLPAPNYKLKKLGGWKDKYVHPLQRMHFSWEYVDL